MASEQQEQISKTFETLAGAYKKNLDTAKKLLNKHDRQSLKTVFIASMEYPLEETIVLDTEDQKALMDVLIAIQQDKTHMAMLVAAEQAAAEAANNQTTEEVADE